MVLVVKLALIFRVSIYRGSHIRTILISLMASLSSLLYSAAVFLLLNLLISTKKVASNHVLSVKSLLPKEVCSASKDVPPSGLKLVDSHGPCSPNVHKPPSTHDMQVLHQDQLRANWLQSITTTASTPTPTQTQSAIPVKSGIPKVSTSNYVLTLGIGTPSLQQTVVLDTGSSITWVQCQPCEGYCYPQQEKMFDPRTSSTYHNISCTSAYCSADIVPHSCFGSTCVYVINYGDGTIAEGYYASETLTLSSTDVVKNFRFGCGEYSMVYGQKFAGILGLGRESASLVSQTTSRYGGIFYYCIPPTQSSTGYVAFGGSSVPANVQYTPMVTHNSLTAYYFLELISISVDGTTLPVDPALFSNAGVLIDSGTVITRLPPTAYSALRSAFRSKMTQYPKSPAVGILDTCYDLRKYANVTLPSVGLQFRGVSVKLDPSGIVWVASSSQTCLAFAANRADTSLAIFGNTNQRRLSVVYDVPNLRIGFSPNGC